MGIPSSTFLLDRIIEQGKPTVARPARASGYDPREKLNKTERLYADILESRRRSGEITGYYVQSFTLLLGPACRYTPDFLVIEADGTLTFIDTKGGFTREDAVIKLKTAAAQYPHFRFKMIENRKGNFVEVRRLNEWAGAA